MHFNCNVPNAISVDAEYIVWCISINLMHYKEVKLVLICVNACRCTYVRTHIFWFNIKDYDGKKKKKKQTETEML